MVAGDEGESLLDERVDAVEFVAAALAAAGHDSVGELFNRQVRGQWQAARAALGRARPEGGSGRRVGDGSVCEGQLDRVGNFSGRGAGRWNSAGRRRSSEADRETGRSLGCRR